MKSKVGVAIAVHNSRDQTRNCLDSLLRSDCCNLHIVVVDDGSYDGTWEMLKRDYPSVVVLLGDGNLWWTGGNNRAIEACLEAGCDYVLLLNPDVILKPDTILQLLVAASKNPNTIISPVVVRHDRPKIVWWAGSRWQPLIPWFPLIWMNRYIFKAGTPVSKLPAEPFFTSEAHGRGVLVPGNVFKRIGLYDIEHLPHYGADTDFSFRATSAGFAILIVPQIRVRLHVENTGLKPTVTRQGALKGFGDYLTQRKNGEAIKVWWHITQRHLPWYSALPSYLAILGWNSYRYWSCIVKCHFSKHPQ